MASVGGRLLDGIFFMNSKTELRSILDGSSNTILIGERSGKVPKGTNYVPPEDDFFDSSWLGVAKCSDFDTWRVTAWTQEGPKNSKHVYAQFNSAHPTVTVFSFCDGSTRNISDDIDWPLFHALGTTKGRETVNDF